MHDPHCPCCRPLSRRDFIAKATVATAALAVPRLVAGDAPAAHPSFIDIHFHHNSAGAPIPGSKDANDPTMVAIGKRSDADVVTHQRNTGALLSVLLGANDPTMEFAKRDPARWVCFAREPADDADGRQRIERMLKKGAIGIGEMKEKVACDSPQMIGIFELARDHGVPVLMHFEDDLWCDGFSRFHRVLEKFPTVNFLGHAQTWWANISRGYTTADGKSPKGKVNPGGLTDRWLADYPNLFCDLSANSGNNALTRDVEFARAFVNRHQDKVIFGSDCICATGVGATCITVRKFEALAALKLDPQVQAKIYRDNARRVLKLKSV
jgi:predicted TIM-barrel fold metal-dependent hydrolase